MCNPVSLVEHERKQVLDSPHRLCVNLWITHKILVQAGFLGEYQPVIAVQIESAIAPNSG